MTTGPTLKPDGTETRAVCPQFAIDGHLEANQVRRTPVSGSSGVPEGPQRTPQFEKRC
jgi:hypothetical protein